MVELRQHIWVFIITLVFWAFGFIFFYYTEDNNLLNIFLISIGVRQSQSGLDFAGFYSLIWPILIEVVILGVILGTLIITSNPIKTSRLLAKKQSDHTVIIGYDHLGERIVEFLRENDLSYNLIEDEEEKISELLGIEPVIIGDYTTDDVLEMAGVSKCKEVFILSNDIRDSIVVSEKVRKLNTDCKLYVRIFEKNFQDYLLKSVKAYAFSTSELSMESVIQWTDGVTGDVLLLGRDNLTQRIAKYVSDIRKRNITIIDSQIDPDLFDKPNIKIINDDPTKLRYIEDHVDLTGISQIFITWKNEEEYSDSVYLASRFYQKYPKIQLFVRIFDEELANILHNSFNATVFSTSQHAFKMLQKNVDPHSAISSKR